MSKQLPLRLFAGLALVACGGNPTTPPAGNDACDYISSACHEATGPAAMACHDVGHDDDLATCEAMLAGCLASCTSDAGTPVDGAAGDAGVDASEPDANVPSDAGPEDVVIRFSPRVGDRAFSCTETYVLGTPPAEASPVDLRLYVHDVRLVSADGAEVPLALSDSDFQAMGVALLDFEDATGSCDQGDAETNAELHGSVPAGEYTGIRFRVGVPFEINHADLTSLPSPLNRTSLFWSWRSGHLFFAGTTRTVVDVGGAPNDHFTHVGSTMCTGDPAAGIPVTECARPNRPSIELDGLDPTSDTIIVDLAEAKADVDVADGAGCHSFTDDCAFPFDAIGLNWATGSVTPTTQTIFRVER